MCGLVYLVCLSFGWSFGRLVVCSCLVGCLVVWSFVVWLAGRSVGLGWVGLGGVLHCGALLTRVCVCLVCGCVWFVVCVFGVVGCLVVRSFGRLVVWLADQLAGQCVG